MKKLRKFTLVLGAAFIAMFAFHSCTQDNELQKSPTTSSEDIELFKFDNSLIQATTKTTINDNGVLADNLKKHAFMDEKEELLESYLDRSSMKQTYLITKTLTEDGIYITMIHPVSVDEQGLVRVPKITWSTGCSSTDCDNCDPKINQYGQIESCDCTTASSCNHTVCRTMNGRKDCCTSSDGCEQCDLWTSNGGSDGAFHKCDCPDGDGTCGHTVTIVPVIVGGGN